MNRFLIALATVLTFACGPTVDTKRDASVPLPAQPAWAWGRRDTVSHYELSPVAQNPTLHQNVQHAILQSLEKKGWRHVDDPAQAQVIVTYHVGIKESTVYQQSTTSMGYGGGWWGGYGWGYYGAPTYSTSTITPEDYTQGALLIVVRDAQSGKVAWDGLYKKEVQNTARVTPEKIQAAVDHLVHDLK